MGSRKKEKTRRIRQGLTGDGMGNVRVKGENFYRDGKRVKALNVRKGGKPQRNAKGDITKAAAYQSKDALTARVEPNRKWFANTRVISQDTLTAFRDAMTEKANDPYQVLLRTNKLPMTLVHDMQGINGLKQHQARMLIESSPFSHAFGPKAQRKRPKLAVTSLCDMAENSEKMLDTYKDRLDQARVLSGNTGHLDEEAEPEPELATAIEPIFSKGKSKRIWNELYKVIDSSDVIIHVLDARDPLGTRCRSVEKYLRTEAPHKHLVFILNKCDLVPNSVCRGWVAELAKEYPTMAFHASITNPYGKGSLIQLLRQFSSLHSSRKQISVGFIGYPNVGKSSIINSLRSKKVCNVAPIPGETKVWQYITLMKRIYLIDCPGVVPPNQSDTPQDILLRGVVRVENVEHPEQYIAAVMSRVKRHHMERTYQVAGWNSHIDFLELLARRAGRLLKGGEPDVDSAAKIVINDFIRGKIPWFVRPPLLSEEGNTFDAAKPPVKRKVSDAGSLPDTSMGPSGEIPDNDKTGSRDGIPDYNDEEEFGGFASESEDEEDGASGGSECVDNGQCDDTFRDSDSDDSRRQKFKKVRTT